MAHFKYTDLALWLREQIEKGQYRDGDRIPTEAELSERFLVSRDTVRKAVAVLEQENLLYKVRGSGTYVDTSDLKLLPDSFYSSRRVGILMNNLDHYIFPSIIKGINTVLNKHGYTSVMQFTNNCISQEREALMDFLEGDFAGLIIEPTKGALPQLNYDLYQRIARTRPAVLIHAKIPGLSLSYVTGGDEKGGLLLTDYLLDQGHKKIAVIFALDDQTGTARYLGFVKAFQNRGIAIPDETIFWYDSSDVSEIFTEPLNARLHAALSSCSAVICQDDRLANYLKKYLALHKEFREDIVICGFDDSEIARDQNLTSVTHPKEEFGECAAMRLLEKIKNPSADVSFEFIPKVVVRE